MKALSFRICVGSFIFGFILILVAIGTNDGKFVLDAGWILALVVLSPAALGCFGSVLLLLYAFVFWIATGKDFISNKLENSECNEAH